MKKITWLFIMALPLFVFAQEKGIHFEDGLSWTEVKAKAKAENKYIFMDCFATWCGPCKMMSKNIFPQQEAGDFFNKNFINVSVQVDKTASDNAEVKAWYADADSISREYEVAVLPTFLVFNPDGEAVHRIAGSSNNVKAFIDLVSEGLDSTTQYYTLTKKYAGGNKDPELLRNLAQAMIKSGNDSIAILVSSEYLATQKNMFTKNNIELIANFTHTSIDNGFAFIYNNSAKIDSIMGNGYADGKLMPIIVQEDLYAKIKGVNPDWNGIKTAMLKRYPQKATQVEEAVAQGKINYSQNTGNYKEMAVAVTDYLKVYRDKTTPEQLNNIAWEFFTGCKDTACLSKAMEWSMLSFKDNNNPMFMDTYANLLYKKGKKKEAIAFEQKAMAMAGEADRASFLQTIAKMKKGEQTWQ